MTNLFKIDDLVKIAKRENNTKRSYLYVNPVQGKHVPVSPSLPLLLFSALAAKIESRYPEERLLVIGFAETATAIGSTIAYKAKNAVYYMNTTRESVAGAAYLFFTESHSHATEQRLVANGMGDILSNVDRVIFAEDEVTTGSTIEKLIRILQGKYADKALKFGIISILNSMPDAKLRELEGEGIPCDCLYRLPVRYRVDEVERHTYLPLSTEKAKGTCGQVRTVRVGGYWNCRQAADTAKIRRLTEKFVDAAVSALETERADRILVLGTEEFMFPGLLIGAEIENRWPKKTVRFHATTRSPIEISRDEEYPLHDRTPLSSLYDGNRDTFIYNLAKYDMVLIITDANPVAKEGLSSLIGALEQYGNNQIILIQWGNFDHEKQLFK